MSRERKMFSVFNFGEIKESFTDCNFRKDNDVEQSVADIGLWRDHETSAIPGSVGDGDHERMAGPGKIVCGNMGADEFE